MVLKMVRRVLALTIERVGSVAAVSTVSLTPDQEAAAAAVVVLLGFGLDYLLQWMRGGMPE